MTVFTSVCGMRGVCACAYVCVQVLDGVDRPTEKCVNGPRVTNMIHRLVRVVVVVVRGDAGRLSLFLLCVFSVQIERSRLFS